MHEPVDKRTLRYVHQSSTITADKLCAFYAIQRLANTTVTSLSLKLSNPQNIFSICICAVRKAVSQKPKAHLHCIIVHIIIEKTKTITHSIYNTVLQIIYLSIYV